MASQGDDYSSTHGRQHNGRFCTYKELNAKSPSQWLKDIACYAILAILLLYCILCIYEIDVKKGSEKDVAQRLQRLSNFSVNEIVNGSIEVTEEFTRIVKATFNASSERGAEITEWMTNKTGTIYSEIKTKIDGEESFLSFLLNILLNIPVYVKNKGAELYNTYLQPIIDKIAGLYKESANEEDVYVEVELTSNTAEQPVEAVKPVEEAAKPVESVKPVDAAGPVEPALAPAVAQAATEIVPPQASQEGANPT